MRAFHLLKGTPWRAALRLVGVLFAALMCNAVAQTTQDSIAYSQFVSDLSEQLQGVGTYAADQKFLASPFIANPATSNMMPIALGATESPDQQSLPVVVSARLTGGGRLVAFGHEGIILGKRRSWRRSWRRSCHRSCHVRAKQGQGSGRGIQLCILGGGPLRPKHLARCTKAKGDVHAY